MSSVSNLPVSVQRLLIGLWRRRWRVVAVAWAVAALIWAAVLLAPQAYESRAHVYAELAPSTDGLELREYYRQRVDALPLQMLTRPQLEKVIARAGLAVAADGASEDERRAAMDRLADRVAHGLTIESPAEMYLVVSYRDSDPETSRALVDAVLAVLMEEGIAEAAPVAPQPADEADDPAGFEILTRRILDHEKKIADNEEAIAALKDARESNAPEEIAETEPAREAASPAALLQARTALRQTDNELAAARARMTEALNRAAGVAPAGPEAGAEIIRLRFQLAELRSRFPDGNAETLTVAARIAQLEENIPFSEDADYAGAQRDLQAAFDAVAVLTARQGALRAGLAEPASPTPPRRPEPAAPDPAQAEALEKLENDQQALKSAHAALLSLREQTPPPAAVSTSAPEVNGGFSFRVVEPPQTALSPSNPSRAPLIVGGFFVALAAGLTAAAAAAAFDDRFSDAAALKSATGLPVLGAVGAAPSAAVLSSIRGDRARLVAACLALVLAGAGCLYLATSPAYGSVLSSMEVAS